MKRAHRILALVSRDSDISAIRKIPGITSLITRKRSYAMEVDLHTDDPERVKVKLSDIASLIEFRILNEDSITYNAEYFNSVLNSESVIIDQAREMFRQERYWEAHTALEDLWKASRGSRKKTLQGIIIVAASLTHYQMDEFLVAEKMYTKALSLIESGCGLAPEEYGYKRSFSYPCLFPEVL